MTYVEKFEISITVKNSQKMKCDLKGSVNMNFQDKQMVNLTKVLYILQAVKNLLSVSRLVSKVATV